MSQPNTTSQNPKPPSSAPSNLSRCRYLPRRTPSMSDTATFTFASGEARTAASTGSSAVAFRAVFFFELAMPGSLRCMASLQQRATDVQAALDTLEVRWRDPHVGGCARACPLYLAGARQYERQISFRGHHADLRL